MSHSLFFLTSSWRYRGCVAVMSTKTPLPAYFGPWRWVTIYVLRYRCILRTIDKIPKAKIYHQRVLPIMIYGTKTWFDCWSFKEVQNRIASNEERETVKLSFSRGCLPSDDDELKIFRCMHGIASSYASFRQPNYDFHIVILQRLVRDLCCKMQTYLFIELVICYLVI